jgi:hypothetical protein
MKCWQRWRSAGKIWLQTSSRNRECNGREKPNQSNLGPKGAIKPVTDSCSWRSIVFYIDDSYFLIELLPAGGNCRRSCNSGK